MPTLLMTHTSVPWHPAIFTHTKNKVSQHILWHLDCVKPTIQSKNVFLYSPCYNFYRVSDENVSDFTCIPLCRCRLAWRGRLSHWGYTRHNPPLGAHHRLQAYKYGALCSTSNQIDTGFLLAPEGHSPSHNCSRAENAKISYTQKYHPFTLCY